MAGNVVTGSPLLILVVVVVVPLLSILVLSRRPWLQRRKPLPPGPRNWPVIGALLSLSQPAHLAFHRLAVKYGPIVHLRLGMTPFIVINSSKYARMVLKEQDAEFASRPYLAAGKHLSWNWSGIGLTPLGPEWRQRRRILTENLFSTQRFLGFERVRAEEVAESLREVDAALKAKKTVNMSNLFTTLGMNHMCRVLVSKRFFGDNVPVSELMTEFRSAMRNISQVAGALCVGDIIPALRPLDIMGVEAELKRCQGQLRGLISFLKQEKEKQKQNGQEEPGQADLFEVLLGLHKQKEITESTLYTLTWDMIVAGSDTSAVSLEWAFSQLLRNPAVVAKAQAELDSVVGRSRQVEASDMPRLPYLNAIVKESWRLNPPLGILLPHHNEAATTLGEYYIPAKSTVLINAHTIHRDPETWLDRPDEFLPERFLTPELRDVDAIGKTFELVPFGGGRRRCPGYMFSHAIILKCLASLLHVYDWSTPPGVRPQDMDMEAVFGAVVSRATELVAMPTGYRIDPSVYAL